MSCGRPWAGLRAQASQALSCLSRPRPSVLHTRSCGAGAAESLPCQAGGVAVCPEPELQRDPLLPSVISCPVSPQGLLRTERGWRGSPRRATSQPRLPGAARSHVTGPGQRHPTPGRGGSQALSQPRASCSGRRAAGPSAGLCADLARRSRLRTLPGSGDVLALHIYLMGTTLEDGRDHLYFTDEAGAAQRGGNLSRA